MILYHPSKNRGRKPLRGKALKLLIFNTSAVERQRFERKRFDPIPPPFPYPGKGGGSGGYIPRRALVGSTAWTASQGCGAPPRSGGFALDRQPRLCYGWRGDGGYIQQSLRGRSWEMGGSLLVTVSRRYTKTPLRFLSEAVFCVRLTAH